MEVELEMESSYNLELELELEASRGSHPPLKEYENVLCSYVVVEV